MKMIIQRGYKQTPPLECEFCKRSISFRLHYGHHRWQALDSKRWQHRLESDDGSTYEVLCYRVKFCCGTAYLFDPTTKNWSMKIYEWEAKA